MKSISFILLTVLVAFSVTSCRNNSLTPKTDKIYGPLGKYFKVVDRTYKPINGVVHVEIKRMSEGLPEPWKKEYGMKFGWNSGQVEPKIMIEFFDNSGDIVFKTKTLEIGSSHFLEDQDALQVMINLSAGESCTIPFDLKSKAAVNFALASSFEYHTEDENKDISNTLSDDYDVNFDDLDDEDDDDLDDEDDDELYKRKKTVKSMSGKDEAELLKLIDRYEKLVDKIYSTKERKNIIDAKAYQEAFELSQKISEKFTTLSLTNISPALIDKFNRLATKLNKINSAEINKIKNMMEKYDDDDDDDDDDD